MILKQIKFLARQITLLVEQLFYQAKFNNIIDIVALDINSYINNDVLSSVFETAWVIIINNFL